MIFVIYKHIVIYKHKKKSKSIFVHYFCFNLSNNANEHFQETKLQKTDI